MPVPRRAARRLQKHRHAANRQATTGSVGCAESGQQPARPRAAIHPHPKPARHPGHRPPRRTHGSGKEAWRHGALPRGIRRTHRSLAPTVSRLRGILPNAGDAARKAQPRRALRMALRRITRSRPATAPPDVPPYPYRAFRGAYPESPCRIC